MWRLLRHLLQIEFAIYFEVCFITSMLEINSIVVEIDQQHLILYIIDFFLFAIIFSSIQFLNRVRFAYVIGSPFVKALSRLPITLFLSSRSRTYNLFVHILFHASEVSLSLSNLLDEETGSYTVTLFMTRKLPPLISPFFFAFRAINSTQ